MGALVTLLVVEDRDTAAGRRACGACAACRARDARGAGRARGARWKLVGAEGFQYAFGILVLAGAGGVEETKLVTLGAEVLVEFVDPVFFRAYSVIGEVRCDVDEVPAVGGGGGFKSGVKRPEDELVSPLIPGMTARHHKARQHS